MCFGALVPRKASHEITKVKGDERTGEMNELGSEDLHELKSLDWKQEMDGRSVHELDADLIGAELPDEARRAQSRS